MSPPFARLCIILLCENNMFPDIYNLHYEKFSDGTIKCIEDEIPFDLPQGWAWTRLEPLALLITDYVANGSFASLKENVRTYKEKNYALFVRTVDFANNFEKDLSYIDKESYEFLEKSKLFGGELMLSNIGASIGKVFKVPYFDIPMSLAPNSIILRFMDDITTDFFEYVFKSFVGQDYLQFLSSGAAMPKFNKTDLRAMIVPVPPINEQSQINKTIKSILLEIDNVEATKESIKTTIASAKSKILDLAIRGKLVPQDPNDEPASVLLERIRAEKEALIKAGKIKRDKKESIIFKGEDNSYYEKIGAETLCIDELIPINPYPNCEFVRLSTVLELLSGRDLKPDEYNAEHKGIPYITGASNFINGNVCVERWTTAPQVISTIGDLLITCKGTVGEMSFNTMGDVHIARQIMAIRNIYGLNMEYIFVCMMYYLNSIKEAAQGLIPGISRDIMLDLIIPLPSDKYQKEIVTSVKEAFAVVDSIHQNLN